MPVLDLFVPAPTLGLLVLKPLGLYLSVVEFWAFGLLILLNWPAVTRFNIATLVFHKLHIFYFYRFIIQLFRPNIITHAIVFIVLYA